MNTRFKVIKTEELAALLLKHPGKVVLIEDLDACLVAHDSLRVGLIVHDIHGVCVSLSALATSRTDKNFRYQDDAFDPYPEPGKPDDAFHQSA